MTISEIESSVQRILSSFGIVSLEDAKAVDSLTYISIIVAIEEEFGIELPDEVISVNMFLDMETCVKLIFNKLEALI